MEGESAIVGSDKICGAAAPGTVARDQIDSLIAAEMWLRGFSREPGGCR
jgi:hypothetical protein